MQFFLQYSSIGAVTGAVFGPFGGAAGFVGKTAFNAAETATESVISQLMEGSFSFKTLLLDTTIGTLTAGALDSKVAKKAGNLIGQGLNKGMGSASKLVKGGAAAVGKKFDQYVDDLAKAGVALGKKTKDYAKQLTETYDAFGKKTKQFLKDGMAAADTKFKAFADQLKEAGSALGAKFTNGLKPATNVGNFNLDVPNVHRIDYGNLEPTDVQLNYRRAMEEIEAERAAAAAGKQAEAGEASRDFEVKRYGDWKSDKSGKQKHHLNQDAAYGKVVPKDEGVSIELEGNIFKIENKDTPHFKAHVTIEQFWNQFRKGGARYGQTPTNLEYTKALKDSLKNAGLSDDEINVALKAAIKQRIKYGLLGGMEIPLPIGKNGLPRIPKGIPSIISYLKNLE